MAVRPLLALAVISSLALACAPTGSGAALAQSASDMERMLNAVDNQNAWKNVPVSRPAAPAGSLRQMSGGGMGQMPGGGMGQMPGGGMGQMPAGNAMQQMFAKPQGLSNMSGLSSAGKTGPMNLSKRDLLRMFLEGGSGGSTPSPSNNPNKTYNAQENLQIARDQEAQARNAAERARYGNDKGARLSAASEAQNHANAARAAADRATSAAADGPNEASDYAAQARNAADRAQADADRARYNAETGSGGW